MARSDTSHRTGCTAFRPNWFPESQVSSPGADFFLKSVRPTWCVAARPKLPSTAAVGGWSSTGGGGNALRRWGCDKRSAL